MERNPYLLLIPQVIAAIRISLALEKLHQLYRDRGLVVLGFSSDDFFQEEDNEEDAAEVCFEIQSFISVMATSSVRGKDANPVFKALGEAKGYPRWNFSKYIVASDGDIIAKFRSNRAQTAQRSEPRWQSARRLDLAPKHRH